MTSRILTVLFLLCLSIPALADGETTGAALLIIDVQYFYFPDGALPLVEPESASANIARLLEKWRGDGGLVVHVGHKVGQGGDFHCDANPLDGETIFMKEEVNAFRGTGLLAYLQEN